MKQFSLLGLGVLVFAFLALFSPPPAAFSSAPEFVPGELLVSYKPNISRTLNARKNATELATGDTLLDALNQQLGVRNIAPLFRAQDNGVLPPRLTHIFKIKIADTQDVRAAAAQYALDPNVEFAEPNYIAHAIETNPNDAEFAQQWGLAKISASSAWDTTTGNASVTIAIIDSGMDKTHADLASKLWVNPGEVAGNSIDDDANGYVDDVNGWNFVASNNNPNDDNGHGTLVAGIAGAATNNSIGVAGVCWQCKLMPVKVMNAGGSANYSDIALGVLYAAQKGARVINLSLGGNADSQTLHTAIQSTANDYNSVVVAGAGNDDSDALFYPAAYDEVLAVAGTDESDVRVSTSSYGTWVDVSAPGQNIRTTASGGGYATNSGTSLASPFAAGLAGLIRSQNPSWSQALVRAQIINTTNNIDAANPSYVGQLGRGRINAANAMGSPQPKLILSNYTVNGNLNGRPDPNTTASLIVSVTNSWLDASNAQGTLSESDPNVSITNATQNFGDIVAGASAQNAVAFSLVINTGAGYNHAIPLTLHLTADGGYSTDLNFALTTRSSDEQVNAVTYTSDRTWTSDKTYIINGNVAVNTGVTLTIEPGTTIKFNGNYKLWVLGKLNADGTEEQPIIFKSNYAGNWDQILFDNSSEDAVADADGNYISGNILRHVQIHSFNNGITCNSATPYLDNLEFDFNAFWAINCQLGASPLWLLDTDLNGYAQFDSGTTHVLRSKFSGININGVGIVKDNIIQASPVGGGSINVQSGSLIENNQLTNGSINATGMVTVTNNTIRLGEIQVGNGSIVQDNAIEGRQNSSVALRAFGNVTITHNRVIGSDNGVSAQGGTIQNNLIANSIGDGLVIEGSATVSHNTITGHQDSAIKIVSGAPSIQNNNLELNKGPYDIENLSTQNINAQSNWWGTTNTSTIDARIYDFSDGNPTLGQVDFSTALSNPNETAPAYLQNITMNPQSPVGIQSVTFTAHFSRGMNTNENISGFFSSIKRGQWTVLDSSSSELPDDNVYTIVMDKDDTKWIGTAGGVAHVDDISWSIYNTENSGLPSNSVHAIAIEPDGTKWFGTSAGIGRYDGTVWTVFNTSNSGLPNNMITSIAIDLDGSKWFGTSGGGLVHFNDTDWQIYDTSNSELPYDSVYVIVVAHDGSKWIGVGGTGEEGAARFDGTNWIVYKPSNSGIPFGVVNSIAIESNDVIWFGTNGGVGRFDGDSWQSYTTQNSGLPDNYVTDIEIDRRGFKWIATENRGTARFDGISWVSYNPSNSGLRNDFVQTIAVDQQDTKWFGSINWAGVRGGVAALYGGLDYTIATNPQWVSPSIYNVSYEISSIVPKDDYSVTISNAFGTDGVEIAPSTTFSFTVDYAGGITDQTPPTQPLVLDDGAFTASTTQLHATWSSTDAQSAITQYQYAIGTSAGATDVVNWTTPNPVTATQVTKSGLLLTNGQKYYVAVKAKNTAGLWSQVGVSDGITVDINYKTPTPTRTPTRTNTPTSTRTPTSTPTGTFTPTQTNTPTRTTTGTATLTPTNSPTPTITDSPSPLAKPKLQSPKNFAVISAAKVKLDWNDVAGATSYHLIVKQDSNKGKTFKEANPGVSQFMVKKLKPGKTYFWRVQACNSINCYAWSKWWSFKGQ